MINFGWTSIRLRTPIDDQNLWRLEFRPMEMLLTADQNSAFMLLSYLMARLLTDGRPFDQLPHSDQQNDGKLRKSASY